MEESADVLGIATAIDYSSDEDLAFEHGHRGKNPTSRRTPESDPDEVMLSDAAPPRTKTTKLKLATGEGDDEDLGDAMVHDGKDEGGNDKDDKDGGEADGADEDEDMASEEYADSFEIPCPRPKLG